MTQIIRLTESDLHNIIKECCKKTVLTEFMQQGFSLAELNDMTDIRSKLDYCTQYLGNPIGKGTARAVFEIGDDEVLKLARPINLKGGVSQNRLEYNNYKITLQKNPELNTLFPKVYQLSQDGTWVICERVLPIKEYDFETILGVPWSTKQAGPIDYAKYGHNTQKYDKNICVYTFMAWAEATQFYDDERYVVYKNLAENHEWFKLLYTYIKKSGYCSDLIYDNFGIAIRNGQPTIVILDNGWDEIA